MQGGDAQDALHSQMQVVVVEDVVLVLLVVVVQVDVAVVEVVMVLLMVVVVAVCVVVDVELVVLLLVVVLLVVVVKVVVSVEVVEAHCGGVPVNPTHLYVVIWPTYPAAHPTVHVSPGSLPQQPLISTVASFSNTMQLPGGGTAKSVAVGVCVADSLVAAVVNVVVVGATVRASVAVGVDVALAFVVIFVAVVLVAAAEVVVVFTAVIVVVLAWNKEVHGAITIASVFDEVVVIVTMLVAALVAFGLAVVVPQLVVSNVVAAGDTVATTDCPSVLCESADVGGMIMEDVEFVDLFGTTSVSEDVVFISFVVVVAVVGVVAVTSVLLVDVTSVQGKCQQAASSSAANTE
mmetsp:Transcript_88797/g.246670  ORF Transcript_88797/g.246670 Transcript_88797/m.246670 type:complete len:348 (-) Transcript_88797:480-1523(-)